MLGDGDSDFLDPEEGLDFDENVDQFPENYDLEEVFDNQIFPLLKTVINIASEYGIPMVASFQYKNSPDRAMLCSVVLTPQARTCDRISEAAIALSKESL